LVTPPHRFNDLVPSRSRRWSPSSSRSLRTRALQRPHGRSLRLQGLETGVNDRALERAIVMHGAAYVANAFAAAHGRLGRSWGCPALAVDVAQRVIDRIRSGSPSRSFSGPAAMARAATGRRRNPEARRDAGRFVSGPRGRR
jgi:hypothetical protein